MNKNSERSLRWYKKNKKKVLIYRKKWYYKTRSTRLLLLAKYRVSKLGRYAKYKGSAKEKNIFFDLTYKEFLSFWGKPCFYCNSPIKLIGLDRIDNTKGYIINNIVSCCQDCNYMKLKKSSISFINHCIKVSNKWKL